MSNANELSRLSSPDDDVPARRLKNNRKKRSWTWHYFEEVDVEEQTNDKGEQLKRCKILDANGRKCGALYVNDGSTGNAINHLLSEHEIVKEGEMNKVCIFLIFVKNVLDLKVKIY
jgi:hypothetical protein